MATASLPSSFFLAHHRLPLSNCSKFPSLSLLSPSRTVVTFSYKKVRGRRRPPSRVDQSTPSPALYEDELSLRIPVEFTSETDTTIPENEVVKGKDDVVSEGGTLRGLDVLKALEKAVAQKERDNWKGRRHRGVVKSGGKRVEKGESGTVVGSDVRPLEIREDWGPRLEFLEKKILELLNEQMD